MGEGSQVDKEAPAGEDFPGAGPEENPPLGTGSPLQPHAQILLVPPGPAQSPGPTLSERPARTSAGPAAALGVTAAPPALGHALQAPAPGDPPPLPTAHPGTLSVSDRQ